MTLYSRLSFLIYRQKVNLTFDLMPQKKLELNFDGCFVQSIR